MDRLTLVKGDSGSALVLGSDGVAPSVETDRKWLTNVKTDYLIQRDIERVRRKALTLALVNKLNEMLDVDIKNYDPNVPSIRLDGYRFSIAEASHTQAGEPTYLLLVGVKCPFCERENDCMFESREDLGQLLSEPKGKCTNCEKPLSASGTAGC
jgi:hypothetical protein